MAVSVEDLKRLECIRHQTNINISTVVIRDKQNFDFTPLLCYHYDNVQEFCSTTGAATLRLCENEAI